MPRVTVWIRKDNLPKWNGMANKSAWLNTLLANSDDTSEYGKTIKTPIGPVVTVLSEKIPQAKGQCEHGAGPRLCLVKGCKNYQFRRK